MKEKINKKIDNNYEMILGRWEITEPSSNQANNRNESTDQNKNDEKSEIKYKKKLNKNR